MKELSIEEKAKRYDEAIKRAREIHNKQKAQPFNVMLKVFPELKESEDERIRKALTYRYQGDGCISTNEYRIDYKEIRAWLEKQGSEPNWCHHKVDLSNCSEEYCKAYYDGWNNCNMQHSQCKSDGNDVIKCLINGMKFYYEDNEEATWGTEKFSMKVKDILYWLEKQGEQKSYGQKAECSDCQFNYAGECKGSCAMKRGDQKSAEEYNITGIGSKNAQGKLGEMIKNINPVNEVLEQKPAVWSEEDEDILNTIINHFKVDIECTDEDDVIRWLKSLKDRVQPQQEWSEEDEGLRKEIVNYLECQKEDEPTRKEKINSWISWILKHSFSEWTKEEKEAWNKRLDCVINILDWAEEKGRISLSDCQDYSIMLKSLSPQSQWKPSEEQMQQLSTVSTGNGWFDTKPLRELYEQLKKLKE